MTLKYTEKIEKEIEMEVELPFAATDGWQTIIATEDEIIKFNNQLIVRYKKQAGASLYEEEIGKANSMLRLDIDSAYQRLEETIESFRQTA